MSEPKTTGVEDAAGKTETAATGSPNNEPTAAGDRPAGVETDGATATRLASLEAEVKKLRADLAELRPIPELPPPPLPRIFSDKADEIGRRMASVAERLERAVVDADIRRGRRWRWVAAALLVWCLGVVTTIVLGWLTIVALQRALPISLGSRQNIEINQFTREQRTRAQAERLGSDASAEFDRFFQQKQ